MASTSYLTRVIFMPIDDDTTDFSGAYTLLLRAKSMPAPAGTPNTVESTDFENDTQTFELGIKTSDIKEYTANLSREQIANVIKPLADNQTKMAVMQLYGTKGLGEVAKWAYITNGINYTINEVGGTDEIEEITVSAAPSSSVVDVTEDYDVTTEDGISFTVSAVA